MQNSCITCHSLCRIMSIGVRKNQQLSNEIWRFTSPCSLSKCRTFDFVRDIRTSNALRMLSVLLYPWCPATSSRGRNLCHSFSTLSVRRSVIVENGACLELHYSTYFAWFIFIASCISQDECKGDPHFEISACWSLLPFTSNVFSACFSSLISYLHFTSTTCCQVLITNTTKQVNRCFRLCLLLMDLCAHVSHIFSCHINLRNPDADFVLKFPASLQRFVSTRFPPFEPPPPTPPPTRMTGLRGFTFLS